MMANPARHPDVKPAEGAAFVNWPTGPEGQKAISDYKIKGERPFSPNATQPGA